MNAAEFVRKWQGITTSERASAQTHFNDLCRMLGEPAPHDVDPEGTWYAFEKGAEKLGGGDGWADVWKRGLFGWEYKGKDANLLLLSGDPLDVKTRIEGVILEGKKIK
ncbi:MAG: hypothetical protein IH863_05620 [Chloroflexi bacterium]|nr:hypothetical protein [Chloroflexota bacterium]